MVAGVRSHSKYRTGWVAQAREQSGQTDGGLKSNAPAIRLSSEVRCLCLIKLLAAWQHQLSWQKFLLEAREPSQASLQRWPSSQSIAFPPQTCSVGGQLVVRATKPSLGGQPQPPAGSRGSACSQEHGKPSPCEAVGEVSRLDLRQESNRLARRCRAPVPPCTGQAGATGSVGQHLGRAWLGDEPARGARSRSAWE